MSDIDKALLCQLFVGALIGFQIARIVWLTNMAPWLFDPQDKRAADEARKRGRK